MLARVPAICAMQCMSDGPVFSRPSLAQSGVFFDSVCLNLFKDGTFCFSLSGVNIFL